MRKLKNTTIDNQAYLTEGGGPHDKLAFRSSASKLNYTPQYMYFFVPNHKYYSYIISPVYEYRDPLERQVLSADPGVTLRYRIYVGILSPSNKIMPSYLVVRQLTI